MQLFFSFLSFSADSKCVFVGASSGLAWPALEKGREERESRLVGAFARLTPLFCRQMAKGRGERGKKSKQLVWRGRERKEEDGEEGWRSWGIKNLYGGESSEH